jgi:5-methyltetrahydrofolate--homocysteine methyltransferase
MRPFLERIRTGEILIGDGAMGTMLFERGLKPGDCPEQLNLDKPEWLEEIARLYHDAGADIVETNTFGGSPLKLAQYHLDDRTEFINNAAVAAARRAVGDRAHVAGSMGPSGQLLEPYGQISQKDMAENFTRQAQALADAGADLFCVETMTDLSEAAIAVQACKTISPATPVCATMTFDATPRGFFTIMGVTVEQAAQGLANAGADLIGSNCGNGIETMIAIAREFKGATSLPLIIQSNAGLPEMAEGRAVYKETPEFMAEKCRELAAIGVSVIGGCCGTTPEHIMAIRRIVAP